MKLETLLIHAGADPDPSTGAIASPIHLSTTFEHGPAGEELHGYTYIRGGSPTETRLEQALAAAEGGEPFPQAASLIFGSGMAAGVSVLQAISASGPQRAEPGLVLFHRDLYFGYRAVAQTYLAAWGLEAQSIDMTDLDAVQAAVAAADRPVRLLWAETPTNPLLQVLDLASLAEIAHAAGAPFLVDNTFATPVLQNPLHLGADVVLHATTKYIGGHSDVQGGALVFARPDPLYESTRQVLDLLGAVASPFNSWLVLRGLRTLAWRMRGHTSNAQAVAEFLHAHPGVSQVHYPGLSTHPGHAIASRQMRGFGGMLSFQVKGGRQAALRLGSRLRLFTNATSLGGVESLVEHRHSVEGPGSPTPPDLLRLSVGLEDPGDLIEDLRQALA